jgi:hypothetical protein
MGQRLSLMGALMDHRTDYRESEKGDRQWVLAKNR